VKLTIAGRLALGVGGGFTHRLGIAATAAPPPPSTTANLTLLAFASGR
jgi:hypothetical protein